MANNNVIMSQDQIDNLVNDLAATGGKMSKLQDYARPTVNPETFMAKVYRLDEMGAETSSLVICAPFQDNIRGLEFVADKTEFYNLIKTDRDIFWFRPFSLIRTPILKNRANASAFYYIAARECYILGDSAKIIPAERITSCQLRHQMQTAGSRYVVAIKRARAYMVNNGSRILNKDTLEPICVNALPRITSESYPTLSGLYPRKLIGPKFKSKIPGRWTIDGNVMIQQTWRNNFLIRAYEQALNIRHI